MKKVGDMLPRKKNRFWKSGLAAISFVLILVILAYSDVLSDKDAVSETQICIRSETEEIINICIKYYEKSADENKFSDFETIQSIVNCLGENGYSAVDSQNQMNMTRSDKVVDFCKKVEAREEAEIVIIEISSMPGFVKYDLRAKDGNVNVVRSYYKYEKGNIHRNTTGSYQAEHWQYTEEGYLMFSGVWYSEKSYILTLSGVEEYKAFRVQNLNETCLELTRKYLAPITFERNNMFLMLQMTAWDTIRFTGFQRRNLRVLS